MREGAAGSTAQGGQISDIEWVIGTHTHRKGTEPGAEGRAYPFHRQQHGTGRERGGGSSAGVKNLRHNAQGDPDRPVPMSTA